MRVFTPSDLVMVPSIFRGFPRIPASHRGVIYLFALTVLDIFEKVGWKITPGKIGDHPDVPSSVLAVLRSYPEVCLTFTVTSQGSTARMYVDGKPTPNTEMHLSNQEDTDILGWVSFVKGIYDTSVQRTAFITLTRPLAVRDPRSRVKFVFPQGDQLEIHPTGKAVRSTRWAKTGTTQNILHMSWIHLDLQGHRLHRNVRTQVAQLSPDSG